MANTNTNTNTIANLPPIPAPLNAALPSDVVFSMINNAKHMIKPQFQEYFEVRVLSSALIALSVWSGASYGIHHTPERVMEQVKKSANDTIKHLIFSNLAL